MSAGLPVSTARTAVVDRYLFSAMVGMPRRAVPGGLVGTPRRGVPARVAAGGTNNRTTLALEGAVPLHAAPCPDHAKHMRRPPLVPLVSSQLVDENVAPAGAQNQRFASLIQRASN